MKKMMGLFLTVALVIGLFPFTAGAASETDTAGNKVLYGYSPDKVETEGILEEVLASQSETIYIKAAGAITLSEGIVIDGKSVYFDLAGHTVTKTTSDTGFLIKDDGALTMKDTSLSKTGMVYSESSGYVFNVANGSSLTFESGYYKTVKANGTVMLANTTVTINGGTFETVNSGVAAFYMSGINGTMHINGGTFKAYSEERPNILYKLGKINITDYDNSAGNLCVNMRILSDEKVAINTFVTAGSGFIITDNTGNEITDTAAGESFYVAPKHEVVYDLNGGSSAVLRDYRFSAPGNIPVPTWEQVTAPSMKELSHWESNGKRYEGGSFIYVTDGGTTTLKAIWKDQVQYTVILHANNGTSDKITTTAWSDYTLPAELPDGWTVKDGYYFAGWAQTSDGTPLTGRVRLIGDTEFYAIIKIKTYPVIYDGNGTEINMKPAEKTHGRNYSISAKIPEGKTGYKFKGWSETPDGAAVYQPGDRLTENRAYTLYAVWEIDFSAFEIYSYDRKTKTATIFILKAGTYKVIFTDYEDGRVVNTKVVTITPSEPEAVNLPVGNDITLDTDDKIMLWSGLVPMCDAHVLE